MKFIGNHLNSIDNKGRMIVPSKFRKYLKNTVVLSLEFENTLVLRETSEFEKWSKLITEKSVFSKDVRLLQRLIFGRSEKINIDAKGRINISPELLKTCKIKNDVQIVGVGNKIEIHSIESWNKINTSTNVSLENIAEKLSKEE